MKEAPESDQPIISYLLGESSAEEQEEMEYRYFSDGDFLERVLAVEDHLIDAYLRGGLTERERERFERHFLASADRRGKLENTRALIEYLRGSEREETAAASAMASAMVSWKGSLSRLLRPEGLAIRIAFASLALAVIAGLWLYVESRQRGAPPPQAKVEKPRTEQAQPTEPEATIPTAREDEAAQKKEAGNSGGVPPRQKPSPQTHRVTAPEVASFVLTPGLTREAGGTNKLVIPPGVQYLRLQLSVESGKNYKGYRASLLRVGGAEVWSRAISGSQLEGGGKSAGLRSLELSLPARLLSGGEYLLTLTGTTEAGESEVVGDYPFTAARQ